MTDRPRDPRRPRSAARARPDRGAPGSGHFRLSRREFLRVGSTVAGGLLVAVWTPPRLALPRPGTHGGPTASRLNAYLEIAPDGAVRIWAPCPEIGQGVRTSLPMIVAEELGADWSSVRVQQAPSHPSFGGQTVGGSDSVADYWEPLRRAGAAARERLMEAAARRWGVSRSECGAEGGIVRHDRTGRSASFGELAAEAAEIDLPDGETALKPPEEFGLVGSSEPGVDVDDIAHGRATYGLDVRLPGMAFAAVARPPLRGDRVRSFDPRPARAVPGVVDVVEIEPLVVGGELYGAVRGGVAVVAENTWAAIRGRDALNVEWETDPGTGRDTRRMEVLLAERAGSDGQEIVRDEGDAVGAIGAAAREISAEYRFPPLAHACMEPMNFTADCREDRCEVRGPTQDPQFLHALLAAGLGMPAGAIRVRPTLAGGGFGRRLAVDYGVEAALVARAAGRPVQVAWTREDDLRHDYYRTPSHHRLSVGLDAEGRVVGWRHHIVTASLVQNLWSRPASDRPPGLYDVQGAADVPYRVPNLRVEHTPVDLRLQMGSWRSVAHSFNAFAVNCFVDEIAAATGRDALELQLELLGDPRVADIRLPLPGRRGNPRPDVGLLRRVLETAAERGGWGSPSSAGRGRGIACTYYKDSYAAHVADVSVSAEGEVRVHRIVAALDCGRIVNRSGAEAQVEGAAMDGVATVLRWGITLSDGRVVESNFHDYPLLRIDEAPAVEVHLIESRRPPSGAGEPPYPSVAPAVANAIFAASGKRVRRLPARPEDLR